MLLWLLYTPNNSLLFSETDFIEIKFDLNKKKMKYLSYYMYCTGSLLLCFCVVVIVGWKYEMII